MGLTEWKPSYLELKIGDVVTSPLGKFIVTHVSGAGRIRKAKGWRKHIRRMKANEPCNFGSHSAKD